MQKGNVMTNWPDMTDQERNAWLATEVMGWHLVGVYWNTKSNERVPDPIYDFTVLSCVKNDSHNICFDPLHNHNHMALLRGKMRERGYVRHTDDRGYCSKYQKMWVRYCNYGAECMIIGEAEHKDELQAEGAAIHAAKTKEELHD